MHQIVSRVFRSMTSGIRGHTALPDFGAHLRMRLLGVNHAVPHRFSVPLRKRTFLMWVTDYPANWLYRDEPATPPAICKQVQRPLSSSTSGRVRSVNAALSCQGRDATSHALVLPMRGSRVVESRSRY